jgi:hypothetical protein
MSKSTATGREKKRIARKQRKSQIRKAQYAASSARKRGSDSITRTSTPHVGRRDYSHDFEDFKKDLRRKDAMERQDEYDGLSVQEKIGRAEMAPGNAKKELAKLKEQLATLTSTKKK